MRTRARLARRGVLATSGLSRRLGLGAGSTIGGRVGLVLDPSLLAQLAAGRAIALVSGTNGKTTTTRLLADALGREGAVATSGAGANMPAGLVAALAGAPEGRGAALEVDEGYLAEVMRLVAPRVVVALNLSRDQLDRVGEVRMTAARWRDAFASSDATIVANCDDPLVAWAARPAPNVVWVAAGGAWRSDAYHCPECDARIDFDTPPGQGWSCTCGLRRPEPAVRLEGSALVTAGRAVAIDLALPGRFNLANAVMAATAASVLGVDVAEALDAMSRVEHVAGRYARASFGATSVRLLLAKNPAGWAELIDELAGTAATLVVAINARDADGHDPSWLWDVPFERLRLHEVVATGDRRRDLAVRLRYAGVAHHVVEDQLAAVQLAGGLGAQPAGSVDYVGNYTAFQELRRALGAGRGVAPAPASRLHTSPGPSVVPTADGEEAVPRRPARRSGAPGASALRVVVVHPDLLGTYGDAGNGIVLAERAAWRDLEVELVLAFSDRALPRSGDLYCLGGGEDGPQARAAARLADGSLAAAVAGGAHVLAVCAGFQILGSSFPGAGGRPLDGLGLLDVTTVRGTGPRAVGDVVAELDPRAREALPVPAGALGIAPGYRLSGFENHAGVTHLGPGVLPLASVIAGVGNGDGGPALEGAVRGRIVATYLHGPVLARNAGLADLLLGAATGAELAPLDDEEEGLLRAERLRSARKRLRPAIGARRQLR